MHCESCGTYLPEGATTCPRCGRSIVRSPEIDVSLAGPRDQNRWTVFFRWILAIPHFLWLALISVAALFAALAGWLAALVLGRLPDGIRTFLARVVNQYARVAAYAEYLLTSRYPPFSLAETDHDALVLLHPPTRLNRAAVLFRIVLGIPAFIVLQILSSGTPIVMFFVWLVVLVKKRPPASVFTAMASILRYEIRAYAWFLMLTPEYPRGLFGDKEARVPPSVDETSVDAPVGGEPRITRLVLSKAARRIVILTIVVGVVSAVGVQVVSAISSAQSDRARGELEDAYADLEAASNDFARQSQSCAIRGGPDCLQAEVERFAGEVSAFLDELREIEMPEGALPYAADLEREGEAVLAALERMASATSEEAYLSAASTFQERAFAFDEAYARLHQVLLFS